MPEGLAILRMGFRWLQHGLRRTVREIHPDILHGHFVSEHGFYASLAGFSPLVVSAWGSDIMIYPRASPVNRLLVTYALRRSALVHSVAPVLSAKIRELGVPPERILTLPFGVNEGLLDLRAAPRSRPGPVLINTKMLHDVYNFPTLIRAVARLRTRYPTLLLKLSGDGPLRGELERLVEESGLRQHVEFLGVVPRAQLLEHLASADAFVSPSFSEGASVSLLEAMAVGVIPVVSDIPANREWVVHGQNGFLAPPTDEQTLAQAIEAALTRSPEWKQEAVSRNQAMIRARALWTDQMRRMEAAYQELLR
ncbi:MAG: glycosyltransferase [Candidatus Omnitrophica bacterium]|nr:glycosyltransferase [Candidatus Omnitrophota bacterium]